MGTNIGSPDVALGIHANHVGGDKKIVCDAAEEFAGSIEFHQRMLAAMEDVNVARGVQGDASGFYEVLPWGQLEEAGNDVVVERGSRQLVRPLSRGCASRWPKQEGHQNYRRTTAFSVHGLHLASLGIVRRVGRECSREGEGECRVSTAVTSGAESWPRKVARTPPGGATLPPH